MAEKVYCDTNVYVDLYVGGRRNKWINFSETVFEFFKRLGNGDYILIISDWLIEQLKRNGIYDQAEELFKRFSEKGKLLRVKEYESVRKEANKYLHWEDAVHALIAIKNQANYLVTRNLYDFTEFKDKIKVVPPEAF